MCDNFVDPMSEELTKSIASMSMSVSIDEAGAEIQPAPAGFRVWDCWKSRSFRHPRESGGPEVREKTGFPRLRE